MNKWVLRTRLNLSVVLTDLTLSGRLFHKSAAADWKRATPIKTSLDKNQGGWSDLNVSPCVVRHSADKYTKQEVKTSCTFIVKIFRNIEDELFSHKSIVALILHGRSEAGAGCLVRGGRNTACKLLSEGGGGGLYYPHEKKVCQMIKMGVGWGLQSSSYMTELWADKRRKTKKHRPCVTLSTF